MNETKPNPMADVPRPMQYKCRAECLPDVLIFLAATRWAMESFDFEPCFLEDDEGKRAKIPDYDIQFTARPVVGLQDLRWIANSIPDCHVIAESLAPASKYDGERRPLTKLRAPKPYVRARVADGLRDCMENFASNQQRVASAIVELVHAPSSRLSGRAFRGHPG